MKISIITVCYDSALTIYDAINSVNIQTFSNIEHIFIDGGSKDSTVDIINNNSKREKVIVSEKDNGLYDAINKGIKMASGDVLGFVHSDDLLASGDVISEIAKEFNKCYYDGVYGDLNYVSLKDTSSIIRKWKSKSFEKRLLNHGWMPAHPTVFLRKEVYEKHGLFNLNYKIAADYDFIIRIFKDETLKFKYLPKVFTNMRIGGASNHSLKNIMQKSREDYKVIKTHKIGGLYTLFMKNYSKIEQFLK